MSSPEQISRGFEEACLAVLSGREPSLSEGQQYLMHFRQQKDTFDVCRYIIENTSLPFARFQALQIFTEGVMKEWGRVGENSVSFLSWLSSLLSSLRPTQEERVVRGQVEQSIACLLKRLWIHSPKASSDIIMQYMSIFNEAPTQEKAQKQITSCHILTAVLSIFGSDHAMFCVPQAVHVEAQIGFQTTILPPLFQLSSSFVSSLLSLPPSSFIQELLWCFSEVFLSLVTWDFSFDQKIFAKKRSLNNDGSFEEAWKPPREMKECLYSSQLFSSLVKMSLYEKSEEVRQRGLTMLGQLSSIPSDCSLFVQGNDKDISLLSHHSLSLLQAVVTCLSSEIPFSPQEAYLLTQCVNTFVTSWDISMIEDTYLMNNFFPALLQFTNRVCEKSGGGNQTENTDILSDGWSLAVMNLMFSWQSILSNYRINQSNWGKEIWTIFSAFVSLYLRRCAQEEQDDDDEEGICEEEQRDQIISTAIIGRKCAGEVLSTLPFFIDSRVHALTQLLRNDPGPLSSLPLSPLTFEERDLQPKEQQMTSEKYVSRMVSVIGRQLMYCVRLGGGVMCDWEEGEEVFVPESMNMHLAVPDGGVHRLTNSILSLLFYFQNFQENQFNPLLRAKDSLLATTFECLQQWTCTYLLLAHQCAIDDADFCQAYDVEREGSVGRDMVAFIVNQICTTLVCCKDEDVCRNAVKLLSKIINVKAICQQIPSLSSFGRLFDFFNTPSTPSGTKLCSMRPKTKRELVSVFILVAKTCYNTQEMSNMINCLLSPSLSLFSSSSLQAINEKEMEHALCILRASAASLLLFDEFSDDEVRGVVWGRVKEGIEGVGRFCRQMGPNLEQKYLLKIFKLFNDALTPRYSFPEEDFQLLSSSFLLVLSSTSQHESSLRALYQKEGGGRERKGPGRLLFLGCDLWEKQIVSLPGLLSKDDMEIRYKIKEKIVDNCLYLIQEIYDYLGDDQLDQKFAQETIYNSLFFLFTFVDGEFVRRPPLVRRFFTLLSKALSKHTFSTPILFPSLPSPPSPPFLLPPPSFGGVLRDSLLVSLQFGLDFPDGTATISFCSWSCLKNILDICRDGSHVYQNCVAMVSQALLLNELDKKNMAHAGAAFFSACSKDKNLFRDIFIKSLGTHHNNMEIPLQDIVSSLDGFLKKPLKCNRFGLDDQSLVLFETFVMQTRSFFQR